MQPDMTILKATQKGQLPLGNQLSKKAKEAAVLKDLNSASLISFGQLCDDDCQVLLDKYECRVTKNQKLIMQGWRNKNDGLWDIPIGNLPLHRKDHPPIQQRINIIIRKDKTKLDLIRFLHASAFSPVKDTLIKAIKKNHFKSWPGLTAKLVRKSLPDSVATAKGHMNQERQGLQSTKGNISSPLAPDDDDMFPLSDAPNVKQHQVIYAIMDNLSKAYIDLTGRFPHCSSRGNQYILVGYHHDSNAILSTPLRKRTAAEITRGWTILNNKFASAGTEPTAYVIDNEANMLLKTAMTKRNIKYQMVPPNCHRANTAERAIQTYKNHLKAGLASTDPDFPIQEWDRLLEQADLTLNLLRAARCNPKLSAWAYLFGEFDFNATPLAPPGMKIISHAKPAKRASWDFNGEEGWYTGPSLSHYRCIKGYFPKTKAARDTDTVTFFPSVIPIPQVGLEDFLRQAASDIVTILTDPPSTTALKLQVGDTTKNAMLELASIFNRVAPLPKTQLPPSTITPTPRVQLSPRKTVQFQIPSVCPESPRVNVSPQRVDAIPPRVGKTPPYAGSYQQKLPVVDYEPSELATNFRNIAARTLLAQHLFTPTLHHLFQPNGRKETLDSVLRGKDAATWKRSLSNEIGRLAQGNDYGVTSTDTIEFIHKCDVPQGRTVTYANFILDYRPLKAEQHRIRLVAGGDKLPYLDDAGAPAASILETKILLNSVISDAAAGAKFASFDIKDFFLATPMEKPEYMRLLWKHIPEDI